MFLRQSEGSHLEGFGSGVDERDRHEDWHLLMKDSRIRKTKTEDLSIFSIRTFSSLTFMFYPSFLMF